MGCCRPFEVRNLPGFSLASSSDTEVGRGVVRPALATAMAGYSKDDPRLGLAGSPALELSNNEGCCWRISVDAWLTRVVKYCGGCPRRGELQ